MKALVPFFFFAAVRNRMWSQAVARTELSKILATRPWDQIDGIWMQAGCYTAASMQSAAAAPQERRKSRSTGRRGRACQAPPRGCGERKNGPEGPFR